MNPSWKTTTCGAIALAGTIVAAADFGPLATKIATCLASFGTGLGLLFARDNGVSSEQVQAAKKKPDATPLAGSSDSNGSAGGDARQHTVNNTQPPTNP